MPRGQNMKVKRLNRRKKPPQLLPPSPTLPIPQEKKEPSGPGRPAGSFGLRKSLEKEFCSGSPSPVQESIINALVKLDGLQKADNISPRDLVATFSSQKSLIKLLSDLSGKTSPSNNGPSNFDSMSIEELEQQTNEFSHLLGEPHKHLKDGTSIEFPRPALPEGVTQGFQIHVDEPLPRRGRLNVDQD